RVYLVEQWWSGSNIHHRKRHILNQAALFGLGKTWADVITILPQERDSMPDGAVVAPPPPTSPCVIRNPRNGNISYFDGSRRFTFTNQPSIDAWRGKAPVGNMTWVDIDPDTFDAIPAGNPMRFPNHTLVRNSATKTIFQVYAWWS